MKRLDVAKRYMKLSPCLRTWRARHPDDECGISTSKVAKLGPTTGSCHPSYARFSPALYLVPLSSPPSPPPPTAGDDHLLPLPLSWCGHGKLRRPPQQNPMRWQCFFSGGGNSASSLGAAVFLVRWHQRIDGQGKQQRASRDGSGVRAERRICTRLDASISQNLEFHIWHPKVLK